MNGELIANLLRHGTGIHARWFGCEPATRQRIYFANHTSHLDAAVLWSALPANVRALTRPVAARDYWTRGRLRPFLANRVFNAVLIERKKPTPHDNPLEAMLAALGRNCSLIVFPEGTRNPGPDPAPFKSGLYHLAQRRRDVELVPVLLENLNRILPKGEFLPVPLLGSATFGHPIYLQKAETKAAFLDRARAAVIALRSP